MYTVLSDTFGDILICVLRPARISRPRTCRAPNAERTPERGRHFEQGASPRARRDARAAFYSISFSGAFSLWLYTGAAYPYAAITERQDLVLYVPEVSCQSLMNKPLLDRN